MIVSVFGGFAIARMAVQVEGYYKSTLHIMRRARNTEPVFHGQMENAGAYFHGNNFEVNV